MVRPFHPHLVLRLLLLVFAFAQHRVEGCDSDCLIQRMESLLDSKLDKLTGKIESLELTVGIMKIESTAFSQSTSLVLRAITSQLNELKIELASGTATLQMSTNDINSQLSELKIEQDNIGTKLNNVTLINRTKSSDIKDITISNGDLFRKLIDLDLRNFRTEHFWIHFNACPDGIFMGGQCFVVLATEKTQWTGAEAMCRASNLVLAEPSKGIDAPLRRYIHQKYDEGLYWVNGQQNGTLKQFVWRRSNQTLVDNNQLLSWLTEQPSHNTSTELPTEFSNQSVSWLTEQPSYNTSTEFPRDFCVAMVAEEAHWMASPGIPYQPKDCEQTQLYPLCERLLQDTNKQKNPLIILEDHIYTKLDTVRNDINNKQDEIKTATNSRLDIISTNIVNVNNKQNEIKTDTQNRLENIATKIGDVNNKQDEIKTDTNTKLKNMATNIGTVDKKINGCPDGFLIGTTCYSLHIDSYRTWSQAKAKCASTNSIMAEASDGVAVMLRRYLADTAGDGALAWMGAKALGSSWRWNSGGILSSSSPLWYYSPGSNNCLLLFVNLSEWRGNPRKPYYSMGCTTKYHTLCQARP